VQLLASFAAQREHIYIYMQDLRRRFAHVRKSNILQTMACTLHVVAFNFEVLTVLSVPGLSIVFKF